MSGQVVASDVDGDTLSFSTSQGPAHGTLSLNAATGAYTYASASNYNGSDSFEVTVSDGNGGTAVQTVSVGIAAVNDAPLADETVSISTNEDTPVTGEVIATDVDGDTLSYKVSQDPANGKVTLDEFTGQYSYTPADNFQGTDSFEVIVDDGNGGTTSQIVKVQVNSINDAPVTDAAVSITMLEDTGVTGQVTATDAEGDTLSFSVENEPQHGVLGLDAATGAYKYASAKDYNGTDSFKIQVADGNGGFATQTITVNITPVNDAPVVTNANVSLSTNEDTPVAGQVTATDVDGDTLSFSTSQGPAHGTVTLNAATGAYTYQGAQDYNGADAFKVTVSDGHGGTAVQTVNVSVAAVNDAPVVTNANVVLSTNEDTPVSGQVVASDVDGDTLSFSTSQGPVHGTVTLNAASGAYTYASALNYNGSDTFKITVADGHGGTAVQTVSVGIAAVNDAPVVIAPTVALNSLEDTLVSGQVTATDVDGDTLSYSIGQAAAHGTVTLNAATGAYTYAATANYSGSDTFKVTVSDGHGGFATQQVGVSITAVADAPTLSVTDRSVAAGITLNGTIGNDILNGTADNDIIAGGDGDDTITGSGPAASKVIGLSITSALTDLDGSESLTVLITGVPTGATLSAGTKNFDGSWSLTQAQLSGLSITAAATDFNLNVTAKSTELTGPSATTPAVLHVTFTGLGDNDTLDGGAGNDKIYGGIGNNVLIDGSGNDFVYGNGGNDTFIAGLGNDTYDGGTGIDTIDISLATQDITVDLAKGTMSGLGTDKLVSIENITGSVFNNTLTGSSVDNRIDGGAGNDQIYGGAGNDTLIGGDGNDQIDGGSGNDIIYDGAGNDTVNGGDGNDYIYAGAGTDKYIGGNGVDTLDYSNATNGITVDASKGTILGFTNDTMSGIENVIGTAFADSFTGGKSNNFFFGGNGNDTFRGMGGTDTYTGGTGTDTYIWFVKDIVTGGNLLGSDIITDFVTGTDKVNLHDFLKNFPGAAIDTVVHTVDSAAGTMISAKNGNNFYDVVMLQGVHGLTASTLFAHGDIIV